MIDKYIQTILAIDWGEKRVGIALKKSESIEAKDLAVIDNDENFWSELMKIIDRYDPNILVVGRPLNLDGEMTRQTYIIKDFAEELAKRTNLFVDMQDETLSSDEAKKRLPKGISLKNGRRLINQISAAIILEDYMR